MEKEADLKEEASKEIWYQTQEIEWKKENKEAEETKSFKV